MLVTRVSTSGSAGRVFLRLEPGELLQELTLPGSEVCRGPDLHRHEQITLSLASNQRHPLPGESQVCPALGTRGDGHENGLSAQARYLSLETQRRLGQADRNGGIEIVSMPLEGGV